MNISAQEFPSVWTSLKSHLKSCFLSENYADLKVIFVDRSSGEEITCLRCHRLILSSSVCPFLQDLISGTPEELIRIEVDGGISRDIWKRIIGFLYDGSLSYAQEEVIALKRACKELKMKFPGQEEEEEEKVPTNPAWKCLNCKEAFRDLSELAEHLRTDCGSNSLFVKCEHCQRLIKKWEILKSHGCLKAGKEKDSLRMDTEDESWSHQSGKETILYVPETSLHVDEETKVPSEKVTQASNTSIKSAIRNVGGPNVNCKKFLCSTCGRTLTGLTAYNRHQVIHTGARPYSCDTCGKTFTQKQRLVVHTRSHTGERPYMCSLCGKTFTESCKLRRHSTKVHKLEQDGTSRMVLKKHELKVPDHDQWNLVQNPPTEDSSLLEPAMNYCSIVKEELISEKTSEDLSNAL